jgi:hypothetical protein
MPKVKVGKLTRRLFTLIALLACLTLTAPSNTATTIAAAPAPASGYQLSGTVYYWGWEVIESPLVVIYKWDGSSWALHGAAYADACGYFAYDTGGPGQFMGSVEGYSTITDTSCLSPYRYYRDVSGSNTAEVSSANPYVYMYITTW